MFGSIQPVPVRYRPRPLTDRQKLFFVCAVLYGVFVTWFLTPGFAYSAVDLNNARAMESIRTFQGTVEIGERYYFVFIQHITNPTPEYPAYWLELYPIRDKIVGERPELIGVMTTPESNRWHKIYRSIPVVTSSRKKELEESIQLLSTALRSICQPNPRCYRPPRRRM